MEKANRKKQIKVVEFKPKPGNLVLFLDSTFDKNFGASWRFTFRIIYLVQISQRRLNLQSTFILNSTDSFPALLLATNPYSSVSSLDTSGRLRYSPEGNIISLSFQGVVDQKHCRRTTGQWTLWLTYLWDGWKWQNTQFKVCSGPECPILWELHLTQDNYRTPNQEYSI